VEETVEQRHLNKVDIYLNTGKFDGKVPLLMFCCVSPIPRCSAGMFARFDPKIVSTVLGANVPGIIRRVDEVGCGVGTAPVPLATPQRTRRQPVPTTTEHQALLYVLHARCANPWGNYPVFGKRNSAARARESRKNRKGRRVRSQIFNFISGLAKALSHSYPAPKTVCSVKSKVSSNGQLPNKLRGQWRHSVARGHALARAPTTAADHRKPQQSKTTCAKIGFVPSKSQIPTTGRPPPASPCRTTRSASPTKTWPDPQISSQTPMEAKQ